MAHHELERLQAWVGLAVLPSGRISGVKSVSGNPSREFEFLIERNGIPIPHRFRDYLGINLQARFSEILSHLKDRGESIELKRFIGLEVITEEPCHCVLTAADRAKFLLDGKPSLGSGKIEIAFAVIRGPSAVPGQVTCAFLCSRCIDRPQMISINTLACKLYQVERVLRRGH
jgi:hypothetical protein